MYYVYILVSTKDQTRYVGLTSKRPDVRVHEHNRRKGHFTRGHGPWKLLQSEVYSDRPTAGQRERFLKSGQGRKWLDQFFSR